MLDKILSLSKQLKLISVATLAFFISSCAPQQRDTSIGPSIDFKKPKTKSFVDFISAIGLDAKKTLIVIDGLNKNVYLSARNLKKSEVVSDSEISTYKIMNAQHLVIEEKAIEKIESNLQ